MSGSVREGGREGGGPLSALASHFLALSVSLSPTHSANARARALLGLRAMERRTTRRRIASKCPFGMHCISIKASAPTRARTSGVNGRRQVRGHCLFI